MGLGSLEESQGSLFLQSTSPGGHSGYSLLPSTRVWYRVPGKGAPRQSGLAP